MSTDASDPSSKLRRKIEALERELAEEKRKLSETAKGLEFYKTLVHSSPLSVMTIEDGAITFINEAGARLAGYDSPSELVGRPAMYIIAPESRELVIERMKNLEANSPNPPAEIWLANRQGATSLVESSSVPVEIGGRRAVLVQGQDMTLRKKAEERYRGLFERMGDAAFLADAETGEILDANRKAEELVGRPREEIVGMHQSALHPPDWHDQAVGDFQEHVAHEGRTDYQSKAMRSDGTAVDVYITATVFEMEGRQCILGLFRDLTEIRERELALRQSEEKFAKLFNASPAWISVLTLSEGRFIEVNKAFLDGLGYHRDEVIGRTSSDINLWADLADRERMAHLLFEQGYVREELLRAVDSAGHIHTLLASAELIEVDDEPCAIVVCLDVTDREEAEKARRESEERHRLLLEHAPVGIAYWTVDGEAVLFNRLAAAHMGGEPEDFVGKNMLDLFGEEAGAFYEERIMAALESDSPEYEDHVVLPIGERWFMSRYTAIRDAGGESLGVQIISHDITEKKLAEEELRASEARFRGFVENANDVIFTLSPEGRLTYASPNWTKLLGHCADEITGVHFSEIVHPDDIERIGELLVESFQTGQSVKDIDYRVMHKDGEWRHHRSNASPIRNEKGEITSFVGIGRDMTEHLATHRALEKSEARYASATSAGRISLWEWDLDMGLFYHDAAFWENLGYSPGDSAADNYLWRKVIHPDDIEDVRARARACVIGETDAYEVEHRVIDHAGKTRWVHARGMMSGEGRRMIGTALDITDRKAAELALAESERRYRTVAQHFPKGAIFLFDRDLRYIFVDGQGLAEAGLSREELIGRTVSEVFPPEMSAVIEYNCRKIFEGKTCSYELEFRGRLYDNQGAPIVKEDGTIAEGVVIARDITDQKAMEQIRMRAGKLESIGILAGGIAHDFNNILMGIVGNLSLAKLGAERGEDISPMVDSAERAAIRATDLTKQLLTFSKGGAPVKKNASIREIVKESADFVLRGSKARCIISSFEQVPRVSVDAGQISQVINNIIINADQSMPMGGRILVRGEEATVPPENTLSLAPGDYVIIAIEDEGGGIEERDLARIFDPYFSTKKEGSGLGLATSYSIIKQHGGVITVDSEPGKGACFSVYLPAAEGDDVLRDAGPDGMVRGEGRVLVLDDDEVVAEVARNMLVNLGYEADVARDGKEAVEKYKAGLHDGAPHDLLVMDLTIPGGMGGREALQEILAADPRAKAIVSSGYSNDPVLADYQEHGFKGVITKPFRMSELSALVARVLAE